MTGNTYREFGNKLLEAKTILLFPHIHVDGDGLGSAVALCMALRKLGRDAWVLCYEDTPKDLDFLESSLVTRKQDIFPEGADLAVMVDCSSMSRIKWRETPFRKAKAHAVIDHHGSPGGDEPIAFDCRIIEPESAACGEMIWLLMKEMGWEIDLPIANALFSAITTDTGNYQHSNTTARSHRITASFYDIPGFNSKPVSALLYERNSLQSLKLEAMLVESIRLYHGGELAIAKTTQKMLEQTGCTMDETEGFVQKIMSVNGVELGCFLKETAGDEVRVSLRAKSYANVARVAQQLGGGGHIRAAGATLPKPIEEAEAKLVELLCAELDRAAAEREE
ncbi:MAG: bifunctional oligoribonuclease/PAP phosphatase NrnA [Mogibacterium sp.]|nr:bifunctional oligoribonuclease/PAP phosphatase NrnA [Mogibacterium sp.]